jgi:hypothetical protein
MNSKRSGAVVRRLGPIGLSLVAAAITAAGFAAISLAKDEGGNGQTDTRRGDSGERGFHIAIGPPGPLGENLSEEDRQKLEDFRACLEDQGVEPPAPPRFDRDNAPEPPTREEMEAMRDEMQQAHEACKDKLPEDLQDIPGPIGGPGCGPGGPPPARRSGEGNGGDNQSQGFVVPAPAPSGSAS